MTMKVHSRSFGDGERIPDLYTCNGKDHAPHIAWSGAPKGTRSFAVIMDDPDAPGGTFAHWGVYDIPPEMTHLDEGFNAEDAHAIGAKQVRNDFGRNDYGGPAPPPATASIATSSASWLWTSIVSRYRRARIAAPWRRSRAPTSSVAQRSQAPTRAEGKRGGRPAVVFRSSGGRRRWRRVRRRRDPAHRSGRPARSGSTAPSP